MRMSKFEVSSEGVLSTIKSAYVLNILGRVADALFFYVLFDRLSVASVGFFSTVMAMAAFIGVVIEFGLGQVLIREFSRQSLTFRQGVYISCLIRVPLILIGLIVFILWIWHIDPPFELYMAIGFAGVIQLMLVAEGLVQAWLKSNGEQNKSNTISLLDPLGRCLAIIFMIVTSDDVSVAELLLTILSTHVVILLIHLAIAKRFQTYRVHEPDKIINANKIFNLTLSGGSFALMGLMSVIQNRADWLLLSQYAGPVQLANYALANKLYEILLMGLGIAVLTVYPWMCRQKRTPLMDLKINIILKITIAAGVTLSLGAAIYLPLIISAFFNEKYEPAKFMIQSILPLGVLSSYIMVRYYQMISKGLVRKTLKYGLISTILQLAVNWFLIPRFGAIGCVAGMGTLVFVTYLTFQYCCIKHKILSIRELIKEFAFASLMSGVALLLWLSGADIIVGLLFLVLLGVVSTLFLLLSPRSKWWILSYMQRKIDASTLKD